MTGAGKLRPARQRRSQRSLERIIEALDELLEAKTFEEITVSEVCKQAGVAVGTFYDRVGNKDALLEHLRARVYAEIVAQIDRAFARERFVDLELRELLQINAREMVAMHRTRRGAIRAIIVEARRSAAFAAHARQLNAALMQRVTAAWLSKRAEFRPDNPQLLARSAFLMAAGFLRETVIWGDLWPGETDPDRVAADLELMLTNFLLPV
ncbi:Transcriptional regulator, TetR family protein [Enhygromyxa salina]|uniref:Transcriptional regulator, TetR family protein n=1 Tax=Enhygromyxa salina TaxID=215803 RepID=A0A0C2CPN0_9BACT|nr:TetR/AcrR family transcriptional regulator [Enhygromyxa salina]KIG13146.1 Transcriptional regulator, TetR family protein [Enhygromyxa salina]